MKLPIIFRSPHHIMRGGTLCLALTSCLHHRPSTATAPPSSFPPYTFTHWHRSRPSTSNTLKGHYHTRSSSTRTTSSSRFFTSSFVTLTTATILSAHIATSASSAGSETTPPPAAIEPPSSPKLALGRLRRPKVIFVLGGPGAGKGTQCGRLVEEFGLVHLSAGELLRRERLSGSEDGQLIDDYIKQGKIVPVRISLNLLKREMERSPANRFLIDGFPRNFDNVQGWEEMMPSVADLERVLVVDCPEDVMVDRLLRRGETSGRTDDNVDTVKKRFATHNEATLPVVNHYDAKGLVSYLPGQMGVDEVYQRTRAAVAPLVEREIIGLTQALLDAISLGDYETYQAICDKDMTCFEQEAKGHLVEGLDFHKFYFDHGNALGVHKSTISQPRVHVLGRTAVMAYIRVVQHQSQDSGAITSSSYEETRVYHLKQGAWKCVHFHRSPTSH